MSEPGPGDSKPLPLRIRLPFGSEQQFIERYGANVDRGGVFIASKSTRPEGTAISFELVLQDGARLMRGEGVVAKVVQSEQAGQSGMRLRFTRLEARSKALVDQIVARREGGAAVDVPVAAPSAPSADAPPRLTEAVLGIDFGATTCRAAVVVDGQPRPIPLDDAGTFDLPSMVGLEADGQVAIGRQALALAAREPDRVLVGLKRLLGRRARGRLAKAQPAQAAFGVVPDSEGDVAFALGGHTVSARALAAQLLGELKAAAQRLLGGEVRRAVLAVPTWFNDRQRRALVEAAADAGLEVPWLVNAPSAVALTFGHGKGLARKRLLVADLGAGSVDAAVIEMTGDDLEVVGAGGDEFAGGADVAADPAKAPAEAQRTIAEGAAAVLVARCIEVTHVVLGAARLSATGIDEVLLVGGQSQAPLVRAGLEQALGRPARTDLDALGAVAAGAALFGAAWLHGERGKAGGGVSEVLGAAIGVAVQGGGLRCVLDANTRLPAEKTLPIPVTAGQTVRLAVFQGAGPRADDCEFQGALELVPERAGELVVHFSVARDGRMTVRATPPGGRQSSARFCTAEPDDDTVARLIAAAPLPGNEASSPGGKGLLGGLRRLLGRG